MLVKVDDIPLTAGTPDLEEDLIAVYFGYYN
jgi:hypothetical protein